MSELVFFLEEPSVQAMLEGLLPQLLRREVDVRYIVFQGKQDLDKQLVRKLRGYRKPGTRFVILRDQDSADCRKLKADLQKKCGDAGKQHTLIRIICHELESWFLADFPAVSIAFEKPQLSDLKQNAKYRSPDDISNAAEELEKITNGHYQKISGSRAIGPLLDPDNTRSPSFAAFIQGLRRLLSNPESAT